jgi:hypothetical protein
LSALHLSLLFCRDIRSEPKIERYTETARGSRENHREHIEADAGADTKTTTKMRNRRNNMKNTTGKSRRTHGSEGPEARDFRIGSKRPPQPNPQLEHPRTSR